MQRQNDEPWPELQGEVLRAGRRLARPVALSLLIGIVLPLLFLIAIQGACHVYADHRRDGLNDAARSLMPDGATVSSKDFGGCESFKPDPDCLIVRFSMPSRDRAATAETMSSLAVARGWTVDSSRTVGRSPQVTFTKAGYRVSMLVSETATLYIYVK